MSVYESFEYEQPEVAGEVFEAFESYETGELNEALELEFAQELLEITSEEELEEFLGKLVRSVARGAKSFVKSGVGRAIGGVLRNVAKTALPMVGSALGSMVAPGLGTAIGGKLGSMASSLLEAEELESMGEAEAELEAARRYVRWATGTVRNGMRAPRGVAPRTVARAAAVSSARRYAPALLSTGGTPPSSWRSRRRGWAAVEPAPQVSVWSSQPERTCACGRPIEPDGGDGWGEPGLDDGLGGAAMESHESQEAFEAFEAFEVPGSHESQETFEVHPSATARPRSGRWYRKAGRIVIVGA